MGKHLSKQFTEQEVIDILERYLALEIGVQEAQDLLKIKRRRFFDLLKNYRQASDNFTLKSPRTKPPRVLSDVAIDKIEQELQKEKNLIEDKDIPVRWYNYSYVQTRLIEEHGLDVSLSSVIRYAKKKGFIKTNLLRNRMITKS